MTEASTKTRILREAAHIFAEKGYEGASMRDLAQALGLSKAALYHHFRSKEAILYQISLLALSELVARGERAIEEEDPRKALLLFMEGHARYLEENRPFFVAMLQGLASLSPPHREETVRLRDRYEASLRRILQRGVEQGVFRPVDLALAGRAVLSLLNWMIRWFKPGGPMRVEEVAREYWDLVLRGLQDGNL